MNVLVLGVTGMLGNDVYKLLSESGINTFGTSRKEDRRVNFIKFDVVTDQVDELLDAFPEVNWIVNCIGIIKTHIHDDDSGSIQNAISVNALFPHILAKEAQSRNMKIIQIATDCVFSGATGKSVESSVHDPWDVYGKTKSLGEVNSTNVMNIRSSIIGKEIGRSTSLLEWVTGQPENSVINGYTNHYWNGVTTLAFAKVCHGIITQDLFQPGIHHLIPSNLLSKMDLVKQIAYVFKRSDIEIVPFETEISVDRTLSTKNPHFNSVLWQSAGYKSPPSIEELVKEYSLTT